MKKIIGGHTKANHNHAIFTYNHRLARYLIIMLGLLTINSSSGASDLYYYNSIPYALCSQALCLDIEGDHKTAECLCPIISAKDASHPAWHLDSISPVEAIKRMAAIQPSNRGPVECIINFFFS